MGLFDIFNSEKKQYRDAEKMTQKILSLESKYAAMSDEELKGCTNTFKEKLTNGMTLEKLLPDAYAAAREAAKRVIGLFPYPVQLTGGVLLNDGDIAEMRTGEGKTLTAVMPIYLNALEGKGAHVVTVNEYLAERDAEWMGDIYRFLGLSVGCNLHSLTAKQKREAYACDITYTTNSELGFDYLRDNMVMDLASRVQRGLHYAVIDEVDSVLIDEARTPLIISGAGPALSDQYLKADAFAKSCRIDEDVEISVEDNTVSLTDKGIAKAEKAFGVENIYAMGNAELIHYIQNALRANFIMKKDVEYVVGEDEIILVDQFTGRKMEGREFSDGLHQALQAKEQVGIKAETQTLATITYQNFFRLYDKLSGMTGTAKTEEDEFLNTYNMRVFSIPTNRPIARVDEEDAVFKNRHEKYEAIIRDAIEIHKTGRPVLIGTVSVNVNEILSEMLKKAGIPHEVLNAKNDEDEAGIIARAGQKNAVTVATNMAGRGTDIKLGEGVAELGGLVVLGSERHESQRIDNQLRGRSGRQGDPGMSRFYVSMEDDLMERYATEESKEVMEAFCKGKKNVAQIRVIINKTQDRATGLHFDSRKTTLEYDNVLMQQREVIYGPRDKCLEMEDIRELVEALIRQNTEAMFQKCTENPGNKERIHKEYMQAMHCPEEYDSDIPEVINANVLKNYDEAWDVFEPIYRQKMEKYVFLRTLDQEWIRHVDYMEHLKTSIRLRGYAQKKPEDAYREEGYIRFNNMMANISEQAIQNMMNQTFALRDELAKQLAKQEETSEEE